MALRTPFSSGKQQVISLAGNIAPSCSPAELAIHNRYMYEDVCMLSNDIALLATDRKGRETKKDHKERDQTVNRQTLAL